MRIDDQVVVVTGGASGLGRATVNRLAAARARVVLVDLPGTAGDEVADAAENIRFVAGDVTDADDVEQAFRVADEWGPLRAVVHTAGIASPVSVFGENPKEALASFRRIVDVNLTGTFNVVQYAVRSMGQLDPVDGDRGVIVTTASIAAYEGTAPAYSATKGGVVSFTLPAARALAPSAIRIVSVAPGAFDTALLRGAGAQVAGQVPHPHRLGDAPEFAALVAHIIENPYINGATLRIDGAMRPTNV
ncbi:SDR family NAD(P)-dependent oxidoreductase [Nocardia sp. NPDC005745]|uniref:SDR family NAD(P)-dependent oxidoreductase n=1 Tax=Nocardia sp. NPDC005745 TaxID=3157061 RepID=UPI0033E39AB9